MTVEAHSTTAPSGAAPHGGAGTRHTSRTHRRSIRNFILQPRFQLKYTGMVVASTVFVASILGYIAYDYSRGQTQLLSIQRMAEAEAKANQQGQPIDPAFYENLMSYSLQEDRRVLSAIVLGIIALVLAVGGTGIVITHRLVGPVYRLKYLFAIVRDGNWGVPGALRKHDELQDLFEAYRDMLAGLREQRHAELEQLDQVLALAEVSDTSDEVLGELRALRERLRRVMQR